MRFNPPPAWGAPEGFDPRRGHLSDPAWAPAPEGWQFWVPDPAAGADPSVVLPHTSLPRGRLESRERLRLVLAVTVLLGLAGVIMWAVAESEPPPPGVGSCWRGDEWMYEVPCSSSEATHIVESRVTEPEDCSLTSSSYLEEGDMILCLRSLG